jgi:hypothetical protein
LSLLKADEATHIDELVEKLENEFIVVRDFRSVVRAGVDGKNQTDAGQKFAEKLLAIPPSGLTRNLLLSSHSC